MVHTIRKRVSWEDGGQTGQNDSDSFQARLHGVYNQDTASSETDFMKLAKEWNESNSQVEDRDLIIQNETIYVLGEGEEVTTVRESGNETGAEFQARLKGVGGLERPRMEGNNSLPAETCKRSWPTLGITSAVIEGNEVHKNEKDITLGDCGAPTVSEISTLQDMDKLPGETLYPEIEYADEELHMNSEEEQEFSSGDEGGVLIGGEKPEILTLLKEEHALKVEVQNEPKATASMNIQDEECSHTKWETTKDLRDDNYLAVTQMSSSTEFPTEPFYIIAVGAANNNYIGTEWIMVNGLKVIVRQGDLVDVEADVIVNPANSELCHGGGAARAILVAAGKELDEECYENIQQFGDITVGNAIHTTPGNLQPRIKHVIHAVGPKALENGDRQVNLDLV